MVYCCQGQKSKQPEESCFLLTINTCQFLQVRPWFDTTHFTTFPDLLTDQFISFCYNCIFQADQPSEWAWQRPSLPVVRHLGIHVLRREHVRPMLLMLRINKWNFLESVIWVIDMYLHIHSLWQRKIMEGFQLTNKFCMLMQFVWIFSKIFIWRERLIIAWIIVLFPKASLLWTTHCYPSTMLAHHWILPWWIKCVFLYSKSVPEIKKLLKILSTRVPPRKGWIIVILANRYILLYCFTFYDPITWNRAKLIS